MRFMDRFFRQVVGRGYPSKSGPAGQALTIFLVGLLLGSAGCSGRPGGDGASDGADSDSTSTAEGVQDESKSGAKSGDSEDSTASSKPEKEAVPVDFAVLEPGDIEAVIRSSANLEAENQVQVVSQAARLVRELRVEEGDTVKKNQTLLRLQSDEQRSALLRAKATFAKAEDEYQRQQRLHEQTLTSDRTLSDAKLEYETQKIAVQDAERELGYTEVRAPIAGTITARMVKVGDQVSLGQHLFDIVDFNSIVARVYVPEKHVGDLEAGQDARIYAESTANREYQGKIDRIAPIVDARTGTVKVTVDVGQQPGLLPGMYVEVDLVTDVHTNTVLVPKRALVYDGDQVFAYRLSGRRVERISVLPLLSDRNYVEPAKGFATGDTIIVAGQAGLRDGALVSLPNDPKLEEGTTDSAEDQAGQEAS